MKKIAIIGTLLFAAVAQAGWQPDEVRARASAQESKAETKLVVFKIVGMVSDSCPVLVKEAVSRIDGVERVSASMKTKTVEVDYIEGRTSPEAIHDVIEDQTGFEAEIERTE